MKLLCQGQWFINFGINKGDTEKAHSRPSISQPQMFLKMLKKGHGLDYDVAILLITPDDILS